MFEAILNKATPKKVFLLDSLGALLTALLLRFVLVNFESTFGMPEKMLYYLISLAVIYCLYSFLCYLFIKQNFRPFLKAIAIANLLYCCLTLGMVIYARAELTILWLIYFLLEAAIVLVLATVELKIVLRLTKNPTFYNQD